MFDYNSNISIHVPLAGNVLNATFCTVRSFSFLSTFPLRGTSFAGLARLHRIFGFLSTFPLRGTSSHHTPLRLPLPNFYPRSPCGERPEEPISRYCPSVFLSTFPLRGTSRSVSVDADFLTISIHVPLAGNVAAGWHRVCRASHTHFYPRSPCGERPAAVCHHNIIIGNFYPRSPCGERRYSRIPRTPRGGNFYPRSPCGERQAKRTALNVAARFLSTFPLRGTSHNVSQASGAQRISIHVPLAGNVCTIVGRLLTTKYFYPRSPCGERLSAMRK